MSYDRSAPLPDLRAFLHDLVTAPPPVRPAPRQPEPRDRSWSAAEARIGIRNAKVTSARAEILPLVGAVPELTERRHWSTGGWGRKKRFNSLLLRRPMMAKSGLEFDALRDFELDPENAWFVEQPLTLRYDFNGMWRTAKPDVLVLRATGIKLVELKYEAQACATERERKWAALGAACGTLGFDYQVVTERHVRRQPRFGNVRMVFSCRHLVVESAKIAKVRDFLGCGTAEAGAVADRFGIKIEQVWYLVRRLALAVDLDAGPLGPTTFVSVRAECSAPTKNTSEAH